MVIAVLGTSSETCTCLDMAVRSLPLAIRGVAREDLPLKLDTGGRAPLANRPSHLIETFRTTAAALDRVIQEQGAQEVDELTVIAESLDLSKNLLEEAGGWDSLVSMLVLAFPDLHWCFATIMPVEDKARKALKRFHGLDSLEEDKAPYSNLFDGSGLRNMIRSGVDTGRGDPKLVCRSPDGVMIAIDDERQYANFSALVAYRNGYRCFAIDSQALALELLGGESPTLKGQKIHWSVEDCYLKFADFKKNDLPENHEKGLKDFGYRLEALKLLKERQGLTMVSSEKELAEVHRQKEEDRKRNEMRPSRTAPWTLPKPVGGLNDRKWRFHVSTPDHERMESGFHPKPPSSPLTWNSRLPRWIRCRECVSRAMSGGASYAAAQAKENLEKSTHSAPGRLVEVANVLIARARWLCQLADSTGSPLPAIRAAVLAKDAQELLLSRTPTTSVMAIELRHEAEMRAESMFAGVVLSEEDVRDRIEEIREEVEKVLPPSPRAKNGSDVGDRHLSLRIWSHAGRGWTEFWTGGSRQRDAAIGGIVSRLLAALEGRHQLDAESELLKEDRRLQNRVHWFQQIGAHQETLETSRASFRSKAWAYLCKLRGFTTFCGMRYLNWLLNGLCPLILSSVLWMLLLAHPLAWLGQPVDSHSPSAATVHASTAQLDSAQGLQYSVFTFLSIGQPEQIGQGPEHLGWFAIVAIMMIMGLFHLGMLISYLYALASRR